MGRHAHSWARCVEGFVRWVEIVAGEAKGAWTQAPGGSPWGRGESSQGRRQQGPSSGEEGAGHFRRGGGHCLARTADERPNARAELRQEPRPDGRHFRHGRRGGRHRLRHYSGFAPCANWRVAVRPDGRDMREGRRRGRHRPGRFPRFGPFVNWRDGAHPDGDLWIGRGAGTRARHCQTLPLSVPSELTDWRKAALSRKRPRGYVR